MYSFLSFRSHHHLTNYYLYRVQNTEKLYVSDKVKGKQVDPKIYLEKTGQVYKFEMGDSMWAKVGDRHRSQLAVDWHQFFRCGDNLFSMGGYRARDKVHMFHISTTEWHRLDDLPEERIDSTVHYADEDTYAYVLGGCDDYCQYFPKDVLKFDTKNLELTVLGKMSTGRRYVGTMKTTTTLWLFGGSNSSISSGFIDRVERVNLDSGGDFEEVKLQN